jgi:hypothetical protein
MVFLSHNWDDVGTESSRCPSPPYSRSFLPDSYENPAIEEGESRVPVEEKAELE